MSTHAQKFLAIPAVIVIVALLIVGAIYWNQSMNQAVQPANAPVAQSETAANPTASNPAIATDLKTYANQNGFNLTYPTVLALKETPAGFTISHGVPFVHPDPCNEKDYTTLNALTDLNLTGSIKQGTPESVIRANNYYGVDFDASGKPIIIKDGILKSFQAGSLSGYVASAGVEGCGTDTYFFPLPANKTLVLTNTWVGEFSSVSADAVKNEKIPGVILPEQGGAYVDQILQSLKINVAEASTAGWKTYTNSQLGFSFQYPSTMSVQTSGYRSTQPFASLPIAYIQTNDSLQTEAYLTVNTSSASNDIGRCSQSGAVYSTGQYPNEYTSLKSTSTSSINSVSYIESDRVSNAGVGTERNYSVIHGGMCYNIEINSFPSACVNSGCEDPQWSAVTEIKLLNELDAVAQTFKFTN